MSAVHENLMLRSPIGKKAKDSERPSACNHSDVLYSGNVPAFAAEELKRLYSNIFSTVQKFENDGSLDGASTYVARDGSEVTAVLLFQTKGRRIQVLNEFIIAPQLISAKNAIAARTSNKSRFFRCMMSP